MMIGTTSPIFIPRDSAPKTVKPGDGYFWIQIHSAQAAFRGKPWEQAKGLVVTSNVNVHHPNLGGEIYAVQRLREVKKNQTTSLGLNQNLIDILPATMPKVSISIDFVLDRENHLMELSGLINSDTLLAVVAIAPGPALVARTVSNLAQKIIQTFISPKESLPILQFSGDFNLAGDSLKEGYYVILGSCDEGKSLPGPLGKLEVRNRMLLRNDHLVDDLSYIILDVSCTRARTREMNGGAVWDTKLREAEDEVQSSLNNPIATNDNYQQGWNKCQALLREAQALIRNDPNYLRREAESIILASYKRCEVLVQRKSVDVRHDGVVKTNHGWLPDTHMDRELLGIPQNDEIINGVLDQYAEQVLTARRSFKAAGMR